MPRPPHTKSQHVEPVDHIPCQGSLLASRGYTKVNGKWVAPASNVDELTKAKMKPRLAWGSSG
jgi:hypothetical protein